jgi:hypothetical protein
MGGGGRHCLVGGRCEGTGGDGDGRGVGCVVRVLEVMVTAGVWAVL